MFRINRNPSPHELRRFATVWLPFGGAAAGAMVWWRLGAGAVAVAIWSAVAALSAASILSAAVARGLFVALSYATYPLGFVASWVALAVVYFVVVTPVALVSRAFGRDPLQLRRPPDATTWWRRRRAESDASVRAFRQF